jgi:pyruvate/2-oxoacid:ferredoxin oxidoreductase beta subunit
VSKKIETYFNQNSLPLPFCPGCGHHTILQKLDQALVRLQLDPQEVVLVTDIGCAGLSDKYFQTHAFHGLHGRSATYATGIKLAHPELTVIVAVGDGGFGIGGHHFLNAARRNIGIKILVFNNFNYGMTGGEHSVTTPSGANTTTTRSGNLERPLDIVSTVGVNGANFAARSSTFDDQLVELICRGIQSEGFALIDIWELCTAYYMPRNQFSKRKMAETLEELGFPTGLIYENRHPEYSQKIRDHLPPVQAKNAVLQAEDLQPRYKSALDRQFDLLIAGAAGAKIVSAGSMFSQGGMLCGLQASQQANYPVTVKTGHSNVTITLSPHEILYTGGDRPGVVMGLFPEGLNKAQPVIEQMGQEDLLILHRDLPRPETRARIWTLDYSTAGRWGKKQEYRALMALAVYLRESNLYPLEALQEAVGLKPRFAEDNLDAIEASLDIKLQK